MGLRTGQPDSEQYPDLSIVVCDCLISIAVSLPIQFMILSCLGIFLEARLETVVVEC